MLVWLSVWTELQTCIWPSWCHCHSLSLAPVKSRLVLPFWYRLTWVVPEKGPLNGGVCYAMRDCITQSVTSNVCLVLVGLTHEMSYTADSIRIRIVTPDSIRIRFEHKRPILRSLMHMCLQVLELCSCLYSSICTYICHSCVHCFYFMHMHVCLMHIHVYPVSYTHLTLPTTPYV